MDQMAINKLHVNRNSILMQNTQETAWGDHMAISLVKSQAKAFSSTLQYVLHTYRHLIRVSSVLWLIFSG